ncbi:methylated-DNA--[protein]-cysteine S-methyltransferase [Bacillaceae bacterium W0354]
MNELVLGMYHAPIGKLLIGGTMDKLYFIHHGDFSKHESWIDKRFPSYSWNEEPFTEVMKQLDFYFAGELKSFSIDYELIGTDFQKKVWEALVTIPFGKTKTYKDLAEVIGNPKAVRAVGGALNKNPISIIIPCHRVVGSSGSLTGYAGGLDRKEHLLALEKKYS